LKFASEKGLSLEVRGRDSDRVTPRVSSSSAIVVEVICAPRSECKISWTASMP
jgi:hypothetical protein